MPNKGAADGDNYMNAQIQYATLAKGIHLLLHYFIPRRTNAGSGSKCKAPAAMQWVWKALWLPNV